MSLPFVVDDGGREAAGFKGKTGDCVTRALAIASGEPYGQVYAELAEGMAHLGKTRSARDGVSPKVYKAWLAERGWVWVPTMQVGQGCRVHLRADELPSGRLVCRLSKHLTAVLEDGIHDTFDPSRGGTRCVYGYWKEAT